MRVNIVTMCALVAGLGLTGSLAAQIPRGWTNVVDYGAVPGDGVSDSASIAAAIASCGGRPGCIYVPPGTYEMLEGVTLHSNLTLRGAGRLVTVLKNMGKEITIVDTASGSSNVSVVDLTLDLSGVGNGLLLNSASGFHVEAVGVRHTYKWGIWASASSDGVITRCCLDDTVRQYLSDPQGGGTHGILLGNDTFDVCVTDCMVSNNHTAGILSYQSSGFVIARNIVAYDGEPLQFGAIRVANGDAMPSNCCVVANASYNEPHALVAPTNVVTGARSRFIVMVGNVARDSANSGCAFGGEGHLALANVFENSNANPVTGTAGVWVGIGPGSPGVNVDTLLSSNVLWRSVPFASGPAIFANGVDFTMCSSNAMRHSTPSVLFGVQIPNTRVIHACTASN